MGAGIFDTANRAMLGGRLARAVRSYAAEPAEPAERVAARRGPICRALLSQRGKVKLQPGYDPCMVGRVILLAAVSTVVACCGSPERVAVTSTATVTVGSSGVAAPQTSLRRGEINDQDRVFLASLQSSSDWEGFFSTVPRADLLDAGEKICGKFERDGKVPTLKSLLDTGFDISQATSLMYAAATAYCPQNLSGVQ